MTEQASAIIEVKTGFFPLAFILFLCTPRIEIDGYVYKTKWGTQSYQVVPGQHKVTVYFGYLWMSRCGENTVYVNVAPGQALHVDYSMPPWMFAAGSMRVW